MTKMKLKVLGIEWEPGPKFLASSAHMGWAAAYIGYFPPHYLPYYLTVIIFFTYITLKEYWADITWLEQDSIKGTTLDWVTYTGGYGIGRIALWNPWLGLIIAVIAITLLTVLDYHKLLPEVGNSR